MSNRRDFLLAAAIASGASVLRANAATAPKGSVLRGFLNISEGQIHYRYRQPMEGTAHPLLMLHGFPSSAWILQPYVENLGRDRPTFAFDLMGMGDSTGLAKEKPEIGDLATAVVHGLDELALSTCDVYGTLTGARVANELALMAPDRIRRVILDEPGVQPPEEIAEFLERYMPSLSIDQEGSQFQRIFNFCRDAYIWFPWYRRELATQRNWVDLPSAEVLHLKTMEILKSINYITGVFEASEKYPVEEKLRALKHPTLVTKDGYPYVAGAERLESERIEAVSAEPEKVLRRAARFRDFLDR